MVSLPASLVGMSQQLERRARALSGIPAPVDRSRPWWRRLLTNPRLWISIVLAGVYFVGLWDQYWLLHPDRPLPDGKVALGLNNEALRTAAFYAMWTALVWTLLFVWLDRWRPQRLVVWLWALGWGACVATWVSIYINTWAGEMMAVQGDAADTGARPAIFIAPFVEEASKATVLFLLAMLMRYQLVNRLNLVALAGLSAVGFAFTENIIYYARAFVFASNTIETGDPAAAMHNLVMLRGVWTSFAHPLFTAMTAIGLAIALRTRSKWVRIVAPLAGFVAAALLHMLFNGTVTLLPQNQLRNPYLMALTLVASMVLFLLTTLFAEGRQIRNRLTDFVRMGWLEPRDPIVFSGPVKRVKLAVASVFRGRRTFLATNRFMRGMTELAYLRDATTRGVVDQAGIEREKELLYYLRDLRPAALTETQGLRTFIWPFRRRPRFAPPPAYPGPSGIAGQWPARP